MGKKVIIPLVILAGLIVFALLWFILIGFNRPISGDNVVIIYARRANTFELDQDAKNLIADYVARSFQTTNRFNVRANTTFVVSDGQPRHVQPEGLYVQAQNPHIRQRRIGEVMNDGSVLYNFLRSDSLNARHEEVDLLAALWLASDLIRGMSGTGNNYILVMEPGVSTTGNFNMRRVNIFDSDVEQTIAERLDSHDMLPDLSNITVVFGNLGSFAGTQNVPHTSRVRNVLRDTWREIIELSGAADFVYTEHWQGRAIPIVHYGNEIPDDVLRPDFNPPFVSSVFFPTPQLLIDPINPIEEREIVRIDLDIIAFTNEELGFRPNSSYFRDEHAANLILEGVADLLSQYFSQNPDRTIHIVGSTARLDPLRPNEGTLCQARAERVRDRLVEFLAAHDGNLDEHIIAVGTRCEPLPWRPGNERNPDGSWNESQAEQNRVVAIFSSADSERVQALEIAMANISAR